MAEIKTLCALLMHGLHEFTHVNNTARYFPVWLLVALAGFLAGFEHPVAAAPGVASEPARTPPVVAPGTRVHTPGAVHVADRGGHFAPVAADRLPDDALIAHAAAARGTLSPGRRTLVIEAGGQRVRHRLDPAIVAPAGLAPTAGPRWLVLDAARGALFVIDASTGRAGPARPLAIEPGRRGLALSDSVLFVGGARLDALSTSGTELRAWTTAEAGCHGHIEALSATAGGKLLVGCSDGRLTRFDPRSGSSRLLAEFDAPVVSVASGDPAEVVFRDGFEDTPLITLLSPDSGAVVNTAQLNLVGEVRADVIELTIDAQPVALNGRLFEVPVTLTEGQNAFVLEAISANAPPESLLVLLTLDTQAPSPVELELIAIGVPGAGLAEVEGFASSTEGDATVLIDNLATAFGTSTSADALGRFQTTLPASAGDPLRLTARDLAGNLSAPVEALVPQPNRPPVLAPIGNQQIELGRTLSFVVSATDPDGDGVFLAANPMPSGASLDTAAGQFRFRPGVGQTGAFTIEFAASDGELADTETVTITVNMTPLGTTRLSGRILDTADFVTGTETPVVGVVTSLLDGGAEAVSGTDGRFAIDDIADGASILDLDPSGALPAPDGSGYAGFRETIEIIPEVDNVIERALLLPRLAGDSAQLVDPNALTIIRNDSIGVRIEIPPHTAKAPDGSDYAGPMSISPVPDNQAPASLPDELGFGLLITIQPVGVYFNQPVPIFFPNADGWPEGAEVDLWSLDANTGRFGVVGTARVVNDELVTVAGGVRAADWHGFLARQLLQILEAQTGCDVCERLRLQTGSETVVATGALRQQHALVTYRALDEDLGLRLVYNSQEASPQPFVRSQVRIPLLKPGQIVARLGVNGIEGAETWFDSTGLQTGERIEIGALADAATLPTGVYPFAFETDAVFQFSRVGTTGRGRLVVVNEADSPFGAGWTLDGLERVREQADGSLLWQRGGGTAREFRALRAGTGRYAGARALIPGRDSFVDGVRNPVAADFDGDGLMDVAFPAARFAFFSNNHVALRINQGDGRFSETRAELLAAPLSVVAADLDADGDPDLAVCGIDFIDILVNDGSATFGPAQRINANNIDDCDQIIAVDLNGDGLPELAYLDGSAPVDRVGLLVAQGGLVWSPAADLIGGDQPSGIAAADLDGDGDVDIAVANRGSDDATVFFNDGNANLSPGPTHTAGDSPRAVATGDINGDGAPDLIVSLDGNDDAVAVLLNDGAGQFGTPVVTGIGLAPRGIVADDLDGDGDIDIAVAVSVDSSLSVLLNNGLGGFPARQQYFTSSRPESVVTADLDGDSMPDLMAHATNQPVVSWLRARGNGAFEDARVLPKNDVGGSGVGRDLVVADFDGDRIDDVAVGIATGGVIDLHFGSGTGFRAPAVPVFAQTGNNDGRFDAADIDSDGDPDLVSIELTSTPFDLVTIINDGSGGFTDGASVLRTELPGRPEDLETGDLNSDGRPDVLVAHTVGSDFALTPYFGRGDGSYTQGTTLPITAAGVPRRVRLGDFDRDGLLDAAVLARQSGSVSTVSVYANDGAGGFVLRASEPVQSGLNGTTLPGDLALADIDGDGRLDALASLAPSAFGPRRLQRLAGLGDGTLAPALDDVATCEQGDQPNGLKLADLDADGDQDLLAACTDSTTIEVFTNDGSGALSRYSTLALGHRGSGGLAPGAIGLADFDLDGAPDLAAATNVGLQFARAEPAATITGYRRPAGEFSTLVKNPDGSFTRTAVDGTVHQFDAAGLETTRSDRNGNAFAFGYDASDRPIAIVDPVGNASTLAYAGAHLASVTGPAGRVTQFEHDADGNLVRITDPDGTQRSFAYDARHRMLAHTDKRGGLTRYEYDANGFQTRVIRADGSVNRFHPASAAIVSRPIDGVGTVANPLPAVRAGELFSEHIDARGQTWRYRTNTRGAMQERIDPLGGVLRVLRNGQGLVARRTDENGAESLFSYNRQGVLIARTEAAGRPEQRVERRVIGAFGLPTVLVDFNGQTTIFERDATGNLTRIVDPLGNAQQFNYNARGQVVSATDARLNTRQIDYDAHGNRLLLTDAEGVVTRFDRDPAGNVIGVTEALGDGLERSRSIDYDALNRITSLTDALGQTTTFAYDPAGNPTLRQAPGRLGLQATYDARDRLTSVSGPLPAMHWSYDGEGAVRSVRDAEGTLVEVVHDAAGREVARISPEGVESLMQRDPVGNLIGLTDGSGQQWTFDYDALRRNTRQIGPDGGVREYRFNGLDQATRIIEPDGNEIGIFHDAAARLVRIVTADDELVYDYDANGNLVRAADGDSELLFEYDALDRASAAITAASGSQPALTQTFAWDALGRRIERADSLGGLETFSWDALDRLTGVTPEAGGSITLDYDPTGFLTAVDYPNGLASRYDMSPDGTLAAVAHEDGSAPLLEQDFDYDARFLLERETEDGVATTFDHDAVYRQVSASGGRDEQYTWDASGNRITSHRSGLHEYLPGNRLVRDDDFEYAYDAQGRLETRTDRVSGLTRDYHYDALSRLSGITREDGSGVAYRYDALGRRIEKSVDGQITRYIHDGPHIAFEFDGSGTLRARFSFGPGLDRPLAQVRDGAAYFYHASHLGHIRLLSDASGAVVNEYDYDSFGNPTLALDTVANPFGFAGRQRDAESGLYQVRARYYDPASGRFISPDPLGFNAEGNNFYAYVLGSPLNFNDPTGRGLRETVSGVVKVGAGIVGFGATVALAGAATPLVAAGIIIVGSAAAASAIGSGLSELISQQRQPDVVPAIVNLTAQEVAELCEADRQTRERVGKAAEIAFGFIAPGELPITVGATVLGVGMDIEDAARERDRQTGQRRR